MSASPINSLEPGSSGATVLPQVHWRAATCSVRGSSHERANLPNQDAMLLQPPSGASLPLALSIADGHGSPKSFRSQSGAEIAVQVAQNSLFKLLEGQHESYNLAALQSVIRDKLPQQVVEEWQRRIAHEIQAQPFRDQELDALFKVQGQSGIDSVRLRPSLAYGSTLLSVLLTAQFIICLQLGDGDILFVDAQGAVTRPIAGDERLFANETTSLCMPDAWKEMHVVIASLEAHLPALIVLSTDGYANSFKSDVDFLHLGRDYLDMIRLHGFDHVAQQLPNFLNEASREGSGDDITLGLIWRVVRPDLETLLTRLAAMEVAVAETATKLSELQTNINHIMQKLDNSGFIDGRGPVKPLRERSQVQQSRSAGLPVGLDHQQLLTPHNMPPAAVLTQLQTAVSSLEQQLTVLQRQVANPATKSLARNKMLALPQEFALLVSLGPLALVVMIILLLLLVILLNQHVIIEIK